MQAENHFKLVHLGIVKGLLHDAIGEISKIAQPTLNPIQLSIVRVMNAIDIQINKLKSEKVK